MFSYFFYTVDFYTPTLLFLLGITIGSFLIVVIDRLSTGTPLTGRSYCNYCEKKLTLRELIPILSFIFLKGKCMSCKKRIPWQYPAVELLTGIMFVLVWLYLPAKNMGVRIANLGIITSLIVVFFADFKYQIIPDEIQLSFFLFALGIAILKGLSISFLGKSVIDGFMVMLPILILYLVTRGRGMGFGDVKLAFIIGFFLKLYGGLVAIYLGFVMGAVAGIILLAFKLKKMKSKIAFGPFLALGTLTVMFFPGYIYYYLFYLINSWGLLFR